MADFLTLWLFFFAAILCWLHVICEMRKFVYAPICIPYMHAHALPSYTLRGWTQFYQNKNKKQQNIHIYFYTLHIKKNHKNISDCTVMHKSMWNRYGLWHGRVLAVKLWKNNRIDTVAFVESQKRSLKCAICTIHHHIMYPITRRPLPLAL